MGRLKLRGLLYCQSFNNAGPCRARCRAWETALRWVYTAGKSGKRSQTQLALKCKHIMQRLKATITSESFYMLYLTD